MLALFNPLAMQQMALASSQHWMNQAMEFSQTVIGVQSEALQTMQEAYLDALQPQKSLPEYTVEGKVCFPAAWQPLEVHAK